MEKPDSFQIVDSKGATVITISSATISCRTVIYDDSARYQIRRVLRCEAVDTRRFRSSALARAVWLDGKMSATVRSMTTGYGRNSPSSITFVAGRPLPELCGPAVSAGAGIVDLVPNPVGCGNELVAFGHRWWLLFLEE